MRSIAALACILWSLGCLAALEGAAWDSHDLHVYGGTAAEAADGTPGGLAGVGWQSRRFYVAGEGSWFGIAPRGRARIRELTGVAGARGAAYGVAAAGGLPLLRRGRYELVPIGLAGYQVARVRGCLDGLCTAGQVQLLDWGAGSVHVIRFPDRPWSLRFGFRVTRALGLGFTAGIAFRRENSPRAPCLQCSLK